MCCRCILEDLHAIVPASNSFTVKGVTSTISTGFKCHEKQCGTDSAINRNHFKIPIGGSDMLH